jgi:dihydropteroate synthase
MFTLNCKGRLLVAEHALVMGIINLTPDSFYHDSRSAGKDSLLSMVEKMLNDGADIIDVGAQSTRPGAAVLSAEDELERLAGAVRDIVKHFPDCILSIDTYYSKVASNCIEAGASIINDISGGRADNQMLSTAASLGAPFVCMHSRGTPETMHQSTTYHNIAAEVMQYFVEREQACRQAGIHDLIIDPGFGFSKNAKGNFELLNHLPSLGIFERPILVGISRKSTIYKTLNTTVEHALNGTTVLNTVALMKGASILRVHDVREARECIRLLSALNGH